MERIKDFNFELLKELRKTFKNFKTSNSIYNSSKQLMHPILDILLDYFEQNSLINITAALSSKYLIYSQLSKYHQEIINEIGPNFVFKELRKNQDSFTNLIHEKIFSTFDSDFLLEKAVSLDIESNVTESENNISDLMKELQKSFSNSIMIEKDKLAESKVNLMHNELKFQFELESKVNKKIRKIKLDLEKEYHLGLNMIQNELKKTNEQKENMIKEKISAMDKLEKLESLNDNLITYSDNLSI